MLAACTHAHEPGNAEIKAHIDSMVAARKAELSQQAKEDLGMRMSVDVKPKVDSIIRARTAKQKPDSAKHW